jgi:hypothetical protein
MLILSSQRQRGFSRLMWLDSNIHVEKVLEDPRRLFFFLGKLLADDELMVAWWMVAVHSLG